MSVGMEQIMAFSAHFGGKKKASRKGMAGIHHSNLAVAESDRFFF